MISLETDSSASQWEDSWRVARLARSPARKGRARAASMSRSGTEFIASSFVLVQGSVVREGERVRAMLSRLREFRKRFSGRAITLSDAVLAERREGD